MCKLSEVLDGGMSVEEAQQKGRVKVKWERKWKWKWEWKLRWHTEPRPAHV